MVRRASRPSTNGQVASNQLIGWFTDAWRQQENGTAEQVLGRPQAAMDSCCGASMCAGTLRRSQTRPSQDMTFKV